MASEEAILQFEEAPNACQYERRTRGENRHASHFLLACDHPEVARACFLSQPVMWTGKTHRILLKVIRAYTQAHTCAMHSIPYIQDR